MDRTSKHTQCEDIQLRRKTNKVSGIVLKCLNLIHIPYFKVFIYIQTHMIINNNICHWFVLYKHTGFIHHTYESMIVVNNMYLYEILIFLYNRLQMFASK